MNEDESDGAEPENLVDLIDALIEPPEPAPIPPTPETWGWAALALAVAALLAWIAWRWMQRHRSNAYRRAALTALAEATTTAEVAVIVRRTALSAWRREDVAGLSGAAWITFLDRTTAEGFPSPAAEELVSKPWRDETAPASPALRRAAEVWLQTHRTEREPSAMETQGRAIV